MGVIIARMDFATSRSDVNTRLFPIEYQDLNGDPLVVTYVVLGSAGGGYSISLYRKNQALP